MSHLSVAIDGRALQSEPLGGVGRYLAGTIPYLRRQFNVVVLTDPRQPSPSGRFDREVQIVELAAPRNLPGLAWLELAVTPWLRRFDGVFHGSFNVAPLSTRRPFVLTLHDLAPHLHSEDFRAATRAAWRLNIRIGVRRAKMLTTVSQFVKGQIIDHFALDPDRVLVAPVAVDQRFAPERASKAPAVARSLGIKGSYVVALGGAPRRGLSVAIEAWRRVSQELEREVTLVVLGEPRLASEPGIRSVGYLDDEIWPALLAGAQALCYPTRYEGFGLPALEAVASGTPVVCAPVSSLPEVLGDAGCWAEQPHPREIATVLVRLLTDHDWHAERTEAGLRRARTAATWEDTAAVLSDAYERAWFENHRQ